MSIERINPVPNIPPLDNNRKPKQEQGSDQKKEEYKESTSDINKKIKELQQEIEDQGLDKKEWIG